ncbi:DUF5020 family protein [candidate division KSB1 bacterium]|nr:DUF5020 family protein [candidate division KSB1 bacterium]
MLRILLAVCLPCVLFAQDKNLFVNLQLHRDIHREVYTSTVEIFELDRYGTTFFFTDSDFGPAGEQSSYFEISRSHAMLRRSFGVLSASLQFNDGTLAGDGFAADGTQIKQIPRTWLGGASLSELKWGPAVFELQALWRQEFAADPGWQLTAVWFSPIPRTRLELLGYVDWNSNETNDEPTSVQAEPQLQYHRGHWALGSELEISRNFAGAYTTDNGYSNRTWYTHPTLFLKVDF